MPKTKQSPEKDLRNSAVSVELIQSKIYLIRGMKIMLDRDLAELYQVETKQLTRQVRRNIDRFPDDFLIQLTEEELNNLRCQFGTSSWGGSRYRPLGFTEQGIAMLSSVLKSQTAVHVIIQVLRGFTKLREFLISHKDLVYKIENLERKFQDKFNEQDKRFIMVFDAIKQLLKEKEEMNKKKGPMGFAAGTKF